MVPEPRQKRQDLVKGAWSKVKGQKVHGLTLGLTSQNLAEGEAMSTSQIPHDFTGWLGLPKKLLKPSQRAGWQRLSLGWPQGSADMAQMSLLHAQPMLMNQWITQLQN